MVKVGILSFAHMHAYGYAHGLSLLKNVEFVGVADENKERGEKAAIAHHTKFFNSYEELIQNVDAVVITSENAKHKDLTIMAANAKKHILCEKPISVSIADAQAMIDVCKKNNVKLQTAFPCRFSPSIQRAKQVIDSGKLGDIRAIASTNHGSMPGGWFTDKKLAGGGAVMDHTVHVADLIRWITGKDFTEVYAEIDQRYHAELNIDDCGMLSMEMSNGVFCTLDPSWSRTKANPIWGDVTMRIIGAKGTIWVDMFNQRVNLYNVHDLKAQWFGWGSNLDAGLVDSFINAVEKDQPVFISGEDGMKAMEVALGAYKSAQTGQPVKLPLV
jgi:UDP-N-acetylglucosamine 3-dehydrogenase